MFLTPDPTCLRLLAQHGQWITTPLRGTGLQAPPSPMLRRTFTTDQRYKQAVLVITALGVYEPWLDGQRVGDLELQPGWTDFRQRLAVQAYDVTQCLTPGEHTLGAWLGDGWYSGKVAAHDRAVLYGDHPLLCAVLLGRDGDADDAWEVLAASDDRWSWSAGPIRSADLIDGESYDARLAVDDWSCPGGGGGDWLPVLVEQSALQPELVPCAPHPVRVVNTLSAVHAPAVHGSGWYRHAAIFDFGQNFTGKVRLKVKGPAGATLRLRYAEVLNPEGTALDTSNLRTCVATDTYTLRGDADGETWTPRFTFHGFRYAAIDYHDSQADPARSDALEPFTAESLTGLVLHNDMPRTGTFETGHDLLNRLQDNITWGLRSNFLEVPTDCPQRDERLGWTGDAQVFAPTASFLFDTSAFFDKWLHDLGAAQADSGSIPSVAPNVLNQDDSGGGWSDAVVLVPWAVYRARGERALLDRHYAAMKRWIDYQCQTIVDGIRGDPEHERFAGYGDWLAIDTDPVDPFANATPRALTGTAYLIRSLRTFGRIATLLGHDADAGHAATQEQNCTDAFRTRFVSDGRINVKSQTANLMALGFDLVEPGERDAVFADLLDLLAERDDHLSTGFLGTPLWCDVLTREGRVDLAYDLLLTETFPGWLYPVTLGATTMWERWNSWHPEKGFVDLTMNSLNHYAYGAVGDWMYRTIGGIDLDMAEDLGPSLHLRPLPDARIGRCTTTLESPVGPVRCAWRCDGDAMRVELDVPGGIRSTLSVPGGEPEPIDPGHHSLTWPMNG